MVLRQFFTLLRQCLIKLSLMENLGSASAVTQWLPTLKQAFSNVNWQNKLKFEKLGSASAVTQWLPELKTSFLYVDQECYNF